MDKHPLLGPFEELVLLSLLRLGDDAYGMGIRREIASRLGRDVAIGAVYSALDRLEAKSYVVSHQGRGDETRRRARRFFRLRPEGARALTRSRALHRRAWEGIEEALLERES